MNAGMCDCDSDNVSDSETGIVGRTVHASHTTAVHFLAALFIVNLQLVVILSRWRHSNSIGMLHQRQDNR